MAVEFDSPQLIVRIEVQALERQLARMLGRTVTRPVVFNPSMDLTTDPAVRWHGAIQLLSSEVMTPHSLIHQGIGAGPIEELVISSLLWVQGSTFHDDLMAGNSQRRGATVRRVIAYMEENLSWPIALPDVAKALDVSVRSVQKAFHDDLGTTPMNYLRDRRLERARAELADALPSDGATVTEVAERWGFGHLGNFSGMYRKRFGESPSETLRR
jgi:AraC-like DNA-binding protein